MHYRQIANFQKYTETDVSSIIRKAGMNPAEIEANFLPHVERLPTGKMNLHLVHKGLAERLCGDNYMEKLEGNPGYIWEKLQENTRMAGFVNDKRIERKKLPISLIVDAEIAAVCKEMNSGPRIKRVPLDYNRVSSAYEKDDPFNTSHSQEHAIENLLRLKEI